MTSASWRMLQWMSENNKLMSILRADAGRIHSGSCELFELYFLHVFHTFGDVPLTDVLHPRQARQVSSSCGATESVSTLLTHHLQVVQGGADAMPVRLKNALVRILTRSLPKYSQLYVPHPPHLQNGPTVRMAVLQQ